MLNKYRFKYLKSANEDAFYWYTEKRCALFLWDFAYEMPDFAWRNETLEMAKASLGEYLAKFSNMATPANTVVYYNET